MSSYIAWLDNADELKATFAGDCQGQSWLGCLRYQQRSTATRLLCSPDEIRSNNSHRVSL
uniref:Uncharacterized protein n=1 Tax=Anguilla anguilla TaxID=7936 RepID=A0A0E9PBI5_ANGAN